MYTPPTHTDAPGAGPKTHTTGTPYRRVRSKEGISMLGLGLVAGAVVGAGIALLVAPESGEDTRRMLKKRLKRRRRETNLWDRLGHELGLAKAMKHRARAMRERARARREEEKAREAGETGLHTAST